MWDSSIIHSRTCKIKCSQYVHNAHIFITSSGTHPSPFFCKYNILLAQLSGFSRSQVYWAWSLDFYRRLVWSSEKKGHTGHEPMTSRLSLSICRFLCCRYRRWLLCLSCIRHSGNACYLWDQEHNKTYGQSYGNPCRQSFRRWHYPLSNLPYKPRNLCLRVQVSSISSTLFM